MNDDKYIGIEVLTNVLSGVTEMIDQRTALLNSMFKEDLYNDFLIAEAMQGGMGGAGMLLIMCFLLVWECPICQYHKHLIQAVVNVEDANLNTSDIGDIDPITTSGSGNNTTQNFNKGGILSSSSSGEADAFQPANKPSKSLEETDLMMLLKEIYLIR